jgi:hypothetical protein
MSIYICIYLDIPVYAPYLVGIDKKEALMAWKAHGQQRRPVDGKHPYVQVEGGSLLFTMRVTQEFQDALEKLAEQWDGEWSKAEVLRELVYRELGEPRPTVPVAPREKVKRGYSKRYQKAHGLDVSLDKPVKKVEKAPVLKGDPLELLTEEQRERLLEFEPGRVELAKGYLKRGLLESVLGMMDQWDELKKPKPREPEKALPPPPPRPPPRKLTEEEKAEVQKRLDDITETTNQYLKSRGGSADPDGSPDPEVE